MRLLSTLGTLRGRPFLGGYGCFSCSQRVSGTDPSIAPELEQCGQHLPLVNAPISPLRVYFRVRCRIPSAVVLTRAGGVEPPSRDSTGGTYQRRAMLAIFCIIFMRVLVHGIVGVVTFQLQTREVSQSRDLGTMPMPLSIKSKRPISSCTDISLRGRPITHQSRQNGRIWIRSSLNVERASTDAVLLGIARRSAWKSDRRRLPSRYTVHTYEPIVPAKCAWLSYTEGVGLQQPCMV